MMAMFIMQAQLGLGAWAGEVAAVAHVVTRSTSHRRMMRRAAGRTIYFREAVAEVWRETRVPEHYADLGGEG